MWKNEVKIERVEYIDIFRGAGIVLMIMGHIGFGNCFDYLILAFHSKCLVSGGFYPLRFRI